MLSRLLTFFSFIVIFSSCSKSSDNRCSYTASGVVVPASEMTSLQSYIAANHPAATLNTGGFYYEIGSAGTGTVTAEICSNVRVTYAGYLTNGTKFDENTGGVTFVLGELIAGWQRGIPLIKKGGSITLYLPPSLGYGSVATGPIPANSILVFNIQLLNVE
jgi:FKBP-type peptidyl-prolyl cis-trans isomerase